MGRSRGFTLIELTAIIILLSIVSLVVMPRFTDSDLSDVQSSRDDLIAALLLAQQLAMARDSSGNPVQFTTTASSIAVVENGSDLLYAGVQYPLLLPSGVTLSPVTTLDYNKLGETTATNFSVSKGGVSAAVTLSESGYAN